MKYLHIKADGTETEVTPKDGKKFTLDELQAFVGGYIERTSLEGGGRYLWLNEEGKLEGLPRNEKATALFNSPNRAKWGDYIVGDVLLCTPAKKGEKA